MTNKLPPENIVLNVQPENVVKEFITIRHGESQYEQKVHIRTVMSSNDTELKLSLLNALYRERITTDAIKTDVLEKLSSKVEFLRDKLVDTQGELKRYQRSFSKVDYEAKIKEMQEYILEKQTQIEDLESKNRIAKSNYEESKLVIQEQFAEIVDLKNTKPWYKRLFGG